MLAGVCVVLVRRWRRSGPLQRQALAPVLWTGAAVAVVGVASVIPLVLVATVSLFALKVSGLVFDGGYTLGERLAGSNKSDLTPTTRDTIPDVTPIIFSGQQPAGAPTQSWAREMFNYGGDITGSVGASIAPSNTAAPQDIPNP